MDAPITDWRVMGSPEAEARIHALSSAMVRAGARRIDAEDLARRWYSSDTIYNHVMRLCEERIAKRRRKRR